MAAARRQGWWWLSFVAAAVFLLLGLHGRWRQVAQRLETVPFEDEDSRQYYSTALNLLRCGLYSPDPPGPCPTREPAAWRGPLYPFFLSLALNHAFSPQRAWKANLAASGAVLLFCAAAAASLFSPSAGAAAAALLAWDPRQKAVLLTLDVQVFYGLLVLLTGLALLSWARRPTAAAAAGTGLLLGVSLCARSTLILFPFFCVALFWSWRRRLAHPGRQCALFLLCCALPTLPWAWRNLSVLGHFQPLEMQTTSFVIASGGLSHVSNDFPMEATAEENSREKIYSSLRGQGLSATGAVIMESFLNILRSPYSYFQACLVRLLNLWGPWLLAWPVALWGLYRLRRHPAAWALAAIPLYWNIHALILSSHRHAAAATPLLCLACGLTWPGRSSAMESPPPAWQRRLLSAAGLLCLLLWAASVRAMVREARFLPTGTGEAARRMERAVWAAQDGKTEQALDLLKELENVPAAYLRASAARLYQTLGRPSRCADILEKLSADYPFDPVLRQDAAVCCELAARQELALSHATAAVRLDPRLLSASLTLGALLERRGRRQDALREYERALNQPLQGVNARQRELIARQRLRLRAALKRS